MLMILVKITTFSTFLFPVRSSTDSGDINWWCNKSPYPEPCKYYLSREGGGGGKARRIQRYEFRDLAVNAAVEAAVVALNHVELLRLKCREEREKAAWTDCLKLHETTVFQLEKTLDTTAKHSQFDLQTWLSSALTNLDTCRNGFVELGFSDKIVPVAVISANVSLLISNSLAINAGAAATEPETQEEEGFPGWVSSGDRRLLLRELPNPDLVVAKDGSGDFCTIREALDEYANRRSSGGRFVIYLKSGVYNEYIEVGLKMKNIMVIGDGWRTTVVTGNRSHGGGFSTFDSATVSVVGDGFIARGITFRNTAGPENGQAVALISRSDRSVFYRCSFEGYQDTLCVHSQRQFYAKSHVFGTVDFIFGNAAVVFQNCFIHGRRPLHGNQIVITAQSRSDPNQNTGISIHGCIVVPAPNHNQTRFRPFVGYLGRPWRDYARVVYLKTYLDRFVPPMGWSPWGNRTENLGTLYYGEYRNYGPGASTEGRVKWSGYHDITNVTEAEKFCVGELIGGQSWLPDAGVPFNPDL